MIPLVLAAVGSAVGNYISAKGAAKSQKAANDQALQMFHESRGASGSAILPEYMKGTEADLGMSAADVVRALYGFGGGVGTRMAEGQNTLARYAPAIEQGDNLVFDLASGRLGAQRKAALAPVLAARTGLAKSRAAAINQSLDQTLAGLRASRFATGFRGGGTFDTARALDATIGARRAAATEFGQAQLDNALGEQSMDESNLQLMLGGLDLPFQRGQQRIAFNGLPAANLASYYASANAPLDFFRMPVANPPNLPPVANNAQIGGSLLASGAEAFGNYYGSMQMAKQMGQFFQQKPTTVNTNYQNPSYMMA